MKKILMLIAPVILIVLLATGIINLNPMKSDLQTLPAKSIQYVREVTGEIADGLARSHPSLFFWRD